MKKNMQVGMWLNILTIMACMWLITSPRFFNFAGTQAELTSNIVIGSVVSILFALLSLIDPSLRLRLRENVVMLLCAIWLCAVTVIYGTGLGAAFWSILAVSIGIVILQALQMAELFLIAYKALLQDA